MSTKSQGSNSIIFRFLNLNERFEEGDPSYITLRWSIYFYIFFLASDFDFLSVFCPTKSDHLQIGYLDLSILLAGYDNYTSSAKYANIVAYYSQSFNILIR